MAHCCSTIECFSSLNGVILCCVDGEIIPAGVGALKCCVLEDRQ
jgi:hypothetical protein